MDINITKFVSEVCPSDLSASMAEIGQSAGSDTWRAAVDESAGYPLIGDENLEEFKEYIGAFGAWSDDEIDAMLPDELNALFLQLVAGDLREHMGLKFGARPTAADWAAYEQKCEAGDGANFYRADDGQVFYSF
jgi:hypothetical protein